MSYEDLELIGNNTWDCGFYILSPSMIYLQSNYLMVHSGWRLKYCKCKCNKLL